jgi:SAM-dependent methyltransferase
VFLQFLSCVRAAERGWTPRPDPPRSVRGCGAAYPARPGRGPDLRPRSELVRSVRQRIPAADAAHPWEESLVEELRPGTGPSLAEACADPYYSYGNRMTPELASRLGLRRGYRLLDVGCGIDNFMRPVIAPLGVDLVGVDYSGEAPDFLVDAHVLPFPDDSFDGVLSLAVLEHLRDPYRVVQEVARVLRPGGVFAGTVAFLEPFHLESLFHHSAYGTWSVLHEAGFKGIEIAPNRSWDVVRANVEMGLVGGAPIAGPGGSRRAVRWLVALFCGAVHLSWRRSRRESVATYAKFTGGFRFVAQLRGLGSKDGVVSAIRERG